MGSAEGMAALPFDYTFLSRLTVTGVDQATYS